MPSPGSSNIGGLFAAFRVFRDRRGVTAIEYALIAALIAVAAIAAFSMVGSSISSTFNSIANSL